jgi:hypothetical protein
VGLEALVFCIMRCALPLVLVAASVSAQTVNTQVNGLSLTNGLSSISDSSALGSNQYVPTGADYLTDSDTSTFAFNLGNSGSGSIQGTFSGAISSSATGIYIVSMAANYGGGPIVSYNGPSFSVQLALQSGLSTARTYGNDDFIITSQKISPLSFYSGPTGVVLTEVDPETQWNSAHYYSYLYIPFIEFSATYNQVVGIKLGDFTAQYPDISFIGVGYTGGGTPPVPEPSTYGLALGGLALAGALIRRRRKRA